MVITGVFPGSMRSTESKMNRNIIEMKKGRFVQTCRLKGFAMLNDRHVIRYWKFAT